ncbi:MAG: PIN domain-containing protein [Verrucomicrobiales bacterium]
MIANLFVDTNILIYIALPLPAERDKALRAAAIFDNATVCFSVQVFQEFYVQATRVSRGNRLTHQEATALITAWKRYPVQEITLELLDRALIAKERWGLSYWDAAIIEAARLQGCAEVLSEDMADGQSYEGVHVVNPFAWGR